MRSRTVTSVLVCIVAALAAASAASAQTPAPPGDAGRERAAALWEEAVRAKGGRERLRSIRSLLITSTVDARAPRGSNVKDAVRLYDMPGRVWVYTHTPAFDVKLDATVINTGRKLCWVTLAPARGVHGLSRCLPETLTQYLLQDPVVYLLETEWVRPVPLRARVEGKGAKQVDVVETEVGGVRLDFHLDRETRLPTRIVTEWYGGIGRATGRLGPMEVLLEDYAEVDGVRMPGRVTRRHLPHQRESVGDPPTGTEERARYRFNVAHDPAVFDAPVPKNVKPDAWKPR